MAKYKVLINGEELDEVFDNEKDATEHALYMLSCAQLGAEILHMSNPGDYEYDEDTYKYPDFEIIEED